MDNSGPSWRSIAREQLLVSMSCWIELITIKFFKSALAIFELARDRKLVQQHAGVCRGISKAVLVLKDEPWLSSAICTTMLLCTAYIGKIGMPRPGICVLYLKGIWEICLITWRAIRTSRSQCVTTQSLRVDRLKENAYDMVTLRQLCRNISSNRKYRFSCWSTTVRHLIPTRADLNFNAACFLCDHELGSESKIIISSSDL